MADGNQKVRVLGENKQKKETNTQDEFCILPDTKDKENRTRGARIRKRAKGFIKASGLKSRQENT